MLFYSFSYKIIYFELFGGIYFFLLVKHWFYSSARVCTISIQSYCTITIMSFESLYIEPRSFSVLPTPLPPIFCSITFCPGNHNSIVRVNNLIFIRYYFLFVKNKSKILCFSLFSCVVTYSNIPVKIAFILTSFKVVKETLESLRRFQKYKVVHLSSIIFALHRDASSVSIFVT